MLLVVKQSNFLVQLSNEQIGEPGGHDTTWISVTSETKIKFYFYSILTFLKKMTSRIQFLRIIFIWVCSNFSPLKQLVYFHFILFYLFEIGFFNESKSRQIKFIKVNLSFKLRKVVISDSLDLVVSF